MNPINTLYQNDRPISDLAEEHPDLFKGLTPPDWIKRNLSPFDVAAIYEGGCSSGAYMPAVTYHNAAETMHNHGDEVLDYIRDQLGELPKPDNSESWTGRAVFYLSYAVEIWASGVADPLAEALRDLEEEEED